jgi:hypothetical protein
MKILRKGDKFQKRKEATADDRSAIKELVGAAVIRCGFLTLLELVAFSQNLHLVILVVSS